jgi:hypothetical protein
MERIVVKSSAIAAVAYDEATETLEAVFHPNKVGVASVWHYKPVTKATFDSMFEEGASVGRIFTAIKATPGIAAYKVGEEVPQAVPA